MLQFQVQRTQRQVGRRHVRLRGGGRVQLRDGVGVALAGGEHAHVGQPQCRFARRLAQIVQHGGFGLGPFAHQFQRQQRWADCCGVQCETFAREAQGTVGLLGFEPGSAQRHAYGNPGGGLIAVRLEHLFHDAGHLARIIGALQETRQCGDDAAALGRRRLLQQRAQRLGDFSCPVQGQQDLHLHAQCVKRLWPRQAPGA